MRAHLQRLAYLVTNFLPLCALAGLFVTVLSLTITPEYPVDDAYISFRYASNWADGYGPVFNPDERVEGYSSFLWVAFLSLAERVGISAPLAARLISMIAVLAILWILLFWSSGRANLGSRLAYIGAAFLVAVSPSTTFNVLSGLEAPLVALLVLLGVYSLQTHFHPLFSAFVLLLLSLTRPEGIFVALAMFTADLATRIVRGTNRTQIQKIIAAWVFGMIVPYAIHLGWRLWFYGDPLPNTIYAKSGFPLDVQLGRSIAYIRSFAELYWPLLLIAVSGLFGINDQMTRNAFAAVIALVLTVSVIGSGDPYPHWRYLYPLLPLAALLAAKGLQSIASKLSGFQPIFRSPPRGVG